MPNVILGTMRGELLQGTPESDEIFGFGGNDVAFGNGGSDFFDMGRGDDVAHGGSDFDIFRMGQGDDVAYGNGGGDLFDMGAGDDVAYGGDGADYFDLGTGDDIAHGGAFDWFDPGAGDDTLYGGQGSVAYGSPGDDTYIGVETLFFFGFGSDAGHEVQPPEFGPNGVIVDLEAGWAIDSWGDTDTLIGTKDIFGSAYDDVIYGDWQNNYFNGNTGADAFYGREGNDTVTYNTDFYTGSGPMGMTIDLGEGYAITIDGDYEILDSIENIRASHFDDTVIGSDVDNTIMGLDGSDDLDGGAGTDTLRYDRDAAYTSTASGSRGDRGVWVDLEEGSAIDGYGNLETIQNFENVTGTRYDDFLYGDAGSNTLTGLGGDDYLRGRAGDDTLHGGDGNDKLDGQEDDDHLWGGAGADEFQFRRSANGDDVVHDFDPTEGDNFFFGSNSQVGDFNDLTMAQAADDVLITFDTGSILVIGVDVDVLTSDLFHFA